ncbi:hypothetical protein ACHAWX_000447, partial [Stephanocyclus meneghinianus]
MKLASLLPIKALCLTLPPLELARKTGSQVTKEFNFKEDLYLRLCTLGNAIGPSSVGLLLSALEGFEVHFKETWESQLKADLHSGTCTVDSYVNEDCFVQRIYYQFSGMTVSCHEDFSYDDLNRDAYAVAAFSGTAFVSILGDQCSDSEVDCLFSSTTSVDVVTSDSDNAKLFISRYLDLPVYLKCLDLDGYGTSTANMLIKALDKYFEIYVAEALTEEILSQVPEAHVYGYASPYKSQRNFCAHGPYFADGNLVDQVRDSDGILITKFTIGFDVIWFKPKDFDQELLPDIESTINEIFVDEDFLVFLQDEYPVLDFIQEIEGGMCNVVDLDSIQILFAPTEAPSPYTRDCEAQWGTGYSCADGNGDGLVDVLDKNSGCTMNRTSSPLPDIQSISPAVRPPSAAPTTSMQSNAPTLIQLESKTPSGSSPQSSPEPTPSPSYGITDMVGTYATLYPTVFEHAITESPVIILEQT